MAAAAAGLTSSPSSDISSGAGAVGGGERGGGARRPRGHTLAEEMEEGHDGDYERMRDAVTGRVFFHHKRTGRTRSV